jgi:hypothetical protein
VSTFIWHGAQVDNYVPLTIRLKFTLFITVTIKNIVKQVAASGVHMSRYFCKTIDYVVLQYQISSTKF